MRRLESAGYVVVDDQAVWGSGPTAQAAWESFLSGMSDAGIKVRGEIDDADGAALERDQYGDVLPDQTPANRYKIHAATRALLDRVAEQGGDIAWRVRGVVACLPDEYDA
jgi:hypothetical protein